MTVNVSGNPTDGFITFQAVGHVTITGRGLPAGNIVTIANKNYIQIIGFNIQDDVNVHDASGIRVPGADDNIQILYNTVHHITGTLALGITAYGTDPTGGISNLVISATRSTTASRHWEKRCPWPATYTTSMSPITSFTT